LGIKLIQARRVLQKSRIPGAQYVINPYTGCVHGCVYCYARFMGRFTGHDEPWGTYLDAKINAPDVLHSQLAARSAPIDGEIFLSSVTDPYQPPEGQYRLTRGCLEVLLEAQPRLSILTKSDLVLRDIDLLRQFQHLSVGLSLMTVDDSLTHILEPRASPPSKRVAALRKLHGAGIRTYAFISPFIPLLTDIDAIFDAVYGAVDEIGVEAINPTGGNWRGVEEALNQLEPGLAARCRQAARDDMFWQTLEGHSRGRAARAGMNYMGFFNHPKDKRE